MVGKFDLSVEISHVLIGKISPFGPNGEPSAIDKKVVSEPIFVNKLGLKGDEQADRRVHGGIDKAIHHFPTEHYEKFRKLLPHISFFVGSFGENLSSRGITENDVCFGDTFKLGAATVQVSQGRQPCWKLNVRFQHRNMAKLVQEHGLTGWYYRVIEEGTLCSADRLTLIDRPYPKASLTRVLHLLHMEPLIPDEIRGILEIPVLPRRWRKIFQKRLENNVVEDTSVRLNTPTQGE